MRIGPLDEPVLEQLAQRVAELVADRPGGRARPRGLVDAETVAAYLGCERGWVYEHASLLRARRLGTGPKARLRFLLDDVDAALTCFTGRESPGGESPANRPVSTRPRRRRMGTSADLLPVEGARLAE